MLKRGNYLGVLTFYNFGFYFNRYAIFIIAFLFRSVVGSNGITFEVCCVVFSFSCIFFFLGYFFGKKKKCAELYDY